MADRPILFSAPMIRALLAGSKTQTRRTLKLQPAPGISIVRKTIRPLDAAPYHAFERRSVYGNYAGELDIRIKRGDRLWVKEAHYITDNGHDLYAVYSEDQQSVYEHLAAIDSMQADLKLSDTWAKPHRKQRPSIFMPRWASRLTLTVTDVRVEKLQDISEPDAVAEGIERHKSGWMPYSTAFYDGDGVTPANYHADPRVSYMQLWNLINGSGAWEANPWVVAYSFTVHHGNIDQIAQVAA